MIKKLTDDYKSLSEKYWKDKLLKVQNKNNSEVTYPIIVLARNIFPFSQVYIKNIETAYTVPHIVSKKYEKILEAYSEKKIYNSIMLRAEDISWEKATKYTKPTLYLTLGRTTYFDSLVTNRSSDFPLLNNFTIRDIFEPGPYLSTLKTSKLSNHLGFNAIIESSDGYIVFVMRNQEVSIGEGTYGTSISASFKPEYASAPGILHNITTTRLKNSIIEEIRAELKIEKNDLEENSIVVLAAYRDCVECGKPQLLIYGKSKKKALAITERFNTEIKNCNSAKNDGLSPLEKKQTELSVMEDGKSLLWINKNNLKKNIVYEYDGIRLDDNTDQGFVEFVNGKKIESEIRKIPMMPSASASVYIFSTFVLE